VKANFKPIAVYELNKLKALIELRRIASVGSG
jgi:hypothetical protein